MTNCNSIQIGQRPIPTLLIQLEVAFNCFTRKRGKAQSFGDKTSRERNGEVSWLSS